MAEKLVKIQNQTTKKCSVCTETQAAEMMLDSNLVQIGGVVGEVKQIKNDKENAADIAAAAKQALIEADAAKVVEAAKAQMAKEAEDAKTSEEGGSEGTGSGRGFGS